MTKRKSTKRALLLSALSLLMCVSMLIGTTFAWFTDSVTSGRNIIQAGNLDVTLKYWDGTAYVDVTDTTKLFNDAALWEPGHTEVAYLEVGNAGSLALKYQLAVNVYEEITGVTEDGKEIKLSDHLVFSVVDKQITAEADLYTREGAIAAAGNSKGLKAYNSDTTALPVGEKDYVALIIYMPETVGNEANHKTGTPAPSITMGTTLVATQYTAESDSFNNEYDKDAWVDGFDVFTEEEFNTALKNGEKNIDIQADITSENGFTITGDGTTTYSLRNAPKAVEINLNGHTLTATGNRAYLFTVEGNASVSIKNGKLVAESTNEKLNGTGVSTGASSSIYFNSTGNLTVEDVEIQGSVRGGHRAINIFGGQATLNNVKINSSYGAGVVAGGEGVSVTLNNCDITVNGMYSAPYNSVCFGVWGGAEMTINSGNYKMINNNTYATGDTHGGWVGIVMSSGGTITTKGGTYTNVPTAGFNPAYERAILEAENNAPAVSTLNLLGGTFVPQSEKIYAGYGDKYYPTYNVPNLIDNGNGTWSAAPEGVDKVVNTAADLLALSAKSFTGNNGVAETYTIMLGANIDMKGATFSAMIAQRGDTLNFLGNGYTISNVKIASGDGDNTTGQASMFYAFPDSTLNVSNLTLKDIVVTAEANGSGYAAAVIGYCEGAAKLTNVDVVNATVIGAKSSGMLVGHLGNGGTLDATGCDVSGTVTLTDYENGGHYAGKLIGTVAGNIKLTEVTCNVTVGGNLHEKNVGDTYGRFVSGDMTVVTVAEDGLSYATNPKAPGEKALYDIPADYAEETMMVPGDVTALGNSVFGYTNVKEVTIPTTVTDFGASGVSDTNASGGAFKNSNVEKVVLTEGMTEIPAAAFNGATKLTEVNIPASVEKIGVNAFRSTAITELVIPATVKEVAYGAFRDMTSLTTVTFEGDSLTLPGYAFRGCTNLRTVYLKCDTLTLNGSMNFANASSNNPGTNNITFYVENETVAAAVKAHMGVGSYVAIYVGDTLYAEIK